MNVSIRLSNLKFLCKDQEAAKTGLENNIKPQEI